MFGLGGLKVKMLNCILRHSRWTRLTYWAVHSVELRQNDDPHWTSCGGWRGGASPPLVSKIKGEIQTICNRAIQLLGEHLIPQSSNTETTVAYKKMLADHHRYLTEITHGDANTTAAENARLTYRDAAATARADLPSHSNIRRGMGIQRYQRGWSRSRSRSSDE